MRLTRIESDLEYNNPDHAEDPFDSDDVAKEKTRGHSQDPLPGGGLETDDPSHVWDILLNRALKATQEWIVASSH